MANSANVLKFLKRKKTGSTYSDNIYFGAEQRFVSALRGTSNNNLEEQNILGMDCIITSEWEDTTRIETKEFRNEELVTGYYILKSQIFNESSDSSFRENELFFTSDLINFQGEYLHIESDEAKFNDNENSVVIPSNLGTNVSIIAEIGEDFKIIRIDTLYYKNKNSELIKVSEKTTYEKKDNGKTITKSIIVNNL